MPAKSKKSETGKGSGRGGRRAGAGRKKGQVLVLPKVPLSSKAEFQEYAFQEAAAAFTILVNEMHHAKTSKDRIMAADKVLDRAVGKPLQNVDIRAIKHTEIEYASAEELRAALLAEGVPPTLLELEAFRVDENDVAAEDAADDKGR